VQHQNVQRLQESFLIRIKILSLEYFPVGFPEFDAVEECWRKGKYHILSTYYSTFDFLNDIISYYYRTSRFNLDIMKYLMRKID
jgi:hypothetical protein